MTRFAPPAPRLIFLALFLLPLIALASDETEPMRTESGAGVVEAQDASSTAVVDEDIEEALARVTEIRAKIAGAAQEARSLDTDARSAKGDDAWALRVAATEIRLTSAADLRQLMEAIDELAEKNVGVTTDLSQLRELVLASTINIRNLFDSLETDLAKVSTDLEAATADRQLELAWRAEQLEALIERLIEMAVDQVSMLDALQLSSDESRAWLAKKIQQRARLATARIHMWSARRANVDELSAAAPNDTSLTAAASAATMRFQASTNALQAAVAMMDDLELDSTQYQQLIVESTGQISADVFDRQVASQLLLGWTESSTASLVENGPGVVLKLLILTILAIVFWTLSRFVRRVTERALRPASVRFSQLLKRMIVSLASGSVVILGILIGLSQLGVEIGPMLTGLGIAGFVIGFALQDTLANFASGIMILAYRPFDVEDLIECAGGVFGKVSQMNLVSTTILTIDNQTLIVPNGKIWGDVITNVTAQRIRRVDLVFGIGYGDDIPKAEKVLTSILEKHPKILADPEFVVKVHELGDSSVNLIVRPWVVTDDYWDVHWDVTREVKMAFDREGISIPFPQRDVHFYNERGHEPEAPSPVTPEPRRDEPTRSETELSAHNHTLDASADEDDG